MGTEEGKIFIGFLAVVFFLAFVIVFFLSNLYRQQRKYRQLQEAKMNAEITANEVERQRLATELHNDIGPYLSSIRMRLSLVDKNEQNAIVLTDCTKALDSCIGQIRAMTKSLSPLTTFDLPFQQALEKYVQELQIKTVLAFSFEDVSGVALTGEANTQVFRILQEIIHNTVKHACANSLRIHISLEEKVLLIRTADDGIGFDEFNVRNATKYGLGLLGIESRVDYLGGTISCKTAPAKGTKYNIRIPL